MVEPSSEYEERCENDRKIRVLRGYLHSLPHAEQAEAGEDYLNKKHPTSEHAEVLRPFKKKSDR